MGILRCLPNDREAFEVVTWLVHVVISIFPKSFAKEVHVTPDLGPALNLSTQVIVSTRGKLKYLLQYSFWNNWRFK